MMTEAIRILYVDDESALLDIGKLYMERSGEFTVTTALSAPEAIRLLEQKKFDAIISDYQMPEMDGIQFLVEVRTRYGQIPFILFTGRGREEIVIQAINSGVDFYLQKGGEPKAQFAELSHKIKQAVSRKMAEDSLRKSEEKYRHLIEHSNEAIIVIQDGMLKLVNHRTIEFTGHSEQELLSMPFVTFIHTDDRAMVMERYQKRMKGEESPSSYRFRLSQNDGSTRWAEISIVVIDWEGRPATLNFITDITERKQAEEALIIQHDLSIILNQYTSLNDAFNQILSAALKIEGLDAGGIYMADPLTGDLDIVAHYGLSPQFIEHTSHFDARSSQVQRARTGIPFFGQYSEIRPPGNDEIRDKEKVTALASIPIIHEGELISILNLASHTTDEIPVSTRHILMTLAMQVGSALVRIRSRKALEESEVRYRNIVEDQTEFICRFLKDGTHVFVNEAYCCYFGKKREEIIGHRFRPSIPPEDQESVARLLASLTTENPVGVIDQRIIMPDGSIRWQRWSDRAIFHADGSLKEYQSVGRDITDRKQAEERLLGSEERLNLAIDGANLGLWDMNLFTGEASHNQRWAEMLGFSMEELKKPSEWWGQRVHPDDYQNVLNLSNLHRAGKVPLFEAVYRMKHKNGEWRWVHSQGKIILRDSNGAALRMIGVNQDITGQKLAEQDILRKNEELEASYEELTATSNELHQTIDKLTQSEQKLSESEEKYRTVFENTGTATVVLEENRIISLANEDFAQLCGFSKYDIEGKKNWTEFVVKEDLELMQVQHRLRRQYETKALTHYEFRFVTKSGDIRNIYLSVGVIPGTKKSVASLLDITDRKRAEELYKTIFENTGTAMIILEEDTTISRINEEMEKIWGYSKEEIEGRVKWPTLVAAEDLQKMLEYHRLRRTVSGSAPRNYEFRFVHKNGTLLDASLTVSMIPGTKKSVVSLRDITELKKIERALRESGERLNFALESAHLGLWDLDLVTFEVVHNRQWTEMLGFSSAEMNKPSSWWQERVHPDDSALVSKSNEDHVAGRSPYFDCIYRMKHENGSWRWVHSQGKVITRDNDGRPLRMIGINRDVTEQKRAEEQLNEREEKYRTIFENAGDAIAIHDLNGNFTEVNDIFCRRFGYSRKELLTMKVGDVDAPVHASNVEKRVQELIKNGHIVFETVHITRDGRQIPTEASAVLFHLDNKPFVMSIARDITGRKVAEEALQQANKKLTLLSSLTRHDINNQLTVLMGYLDILENKQSDSSFSDYFQKVSTAAQRIASMIQFSKEYEKIGVNTPTWQDYRTIVDTAAKQALLGQVEVKNDLPAGAEVFADPLIVKVCYNLMDNAVRYGGKITTLRFSVEERDGDQILICEDDGDGVLLYEKEMIFDRGFGKNTGLGLALSREILSITGITIKETGEPGKGARFEMTVPKENYRIGTVH